MGAGRCGAVVDVLESLDDGTCLRGEGCNVRGGSNLL